MTPILVRHPPERLIPPVLVRQAPMPWKLIERVLLERNIVEEAYNEDLLGFSQ